VRTFDTVEELRAALIDFAKYYTELGSSRGTAIVPQPRCEPIKCRLDQNARTDLKLAA
jgi:hypothetical protein